MTEESAPRSAEEAALLLARTQAAAWFQDLDAERLDVSMTPLATRARCHLLDLRISDGRSERYAVVKIRHSDPALRRHDRFEGERPVLSPQRLLSDDEAAAREFAGLQAIDAAFDGLDGDRFHRLRALAMLDGHAAIVVDKASEPTLRSRLLQTSRLRRPGRHRPMSEVAWSNAGAWLRHFQAQVDFDDLPTSIASADEVLRLVQQYADFLMRRLDRSQLLTRLSQQPDELLSRHLSDPLPMVVGHGDFVPNNMFASASGRITVFDPLPEWRQPAYLDLAMLTMSPRLLPVQTASQGVALAATALDRCERAAFEGYYGDTPDADVVRVFQLLVLLDRWSMLVSKSEPGSGPRRAARQARVRVAVRQVRREAERLVARLDG